MKLIASFGCLTAAALLSSCQTGSLQETSTFEKNGGGAGQSNPYASYPAYGPQGGGSHGGGEGDYVDVTPVKPQGDGPYQPPASGSQPTYQPTETKPVSRGTGISAGATASSGGSYKVVKNDTLYGISRRHNTSVAALKSANGLTSDNIREGQVLRIP